MLYLIQPDRDVLIDARNQRITAEDSLFMGERPSSQRSLLILSGNGEKALSTTTKLPRTAPFSYHKLIIINIADSQSTALSFGSFIETCGVEYGWVLFVTADINRQTLCLPLFHDK